MVVVIRIKATATYCFMNCNLKAMFASSLSTFWLEGVLNLITFVVTALCHVKTLWTVL